ncbi:MAG: gamma carbonic anhydrase family protein [Verrucomicrobiota bacterium]|jgi:carbonic anhydrase/acetyltransferase-like protein (isoleucine patch superfamily)|nr:gamma carbonic anhydrase family protein [Verrucomicrobiota bacterium]MDD8051112.1 gamma carbonic anhydrase family protein [Verrucomicrobiota bacterium]HCF93730.1 gamma carbonic anhydrase family protein [Verrucomicrobiota bacterium]
MLITLPNRVPELRGDGHFIAPNATVIGSVVLLARVSIWFQAVIRADCDVIEIGAESNIQDACVLHTDAGLKLQIGTGVSIGHQCVIHGCRIDDHTLIGMHSTIMNRVHIGRGCLIGAGSLIPEGKVIPDHSVVLGRPGRVIRDTTEADQAYLRHAADHYVAQAALYRGQSL